MSQDRSPQGLARRCLRDIVGTTQAKSRRHDSMTWKQPSSPPTWRFKIQPSAKILDGYDFYAKDLFSWKFWKIKVKPSMQFKMCNMKRPLPALELRKSKCNQERATIWRSRNIHPIVLISHLKFPFDKPMKRYYGREEIPR